MTSSFVEYIPRGTFDYPHDLDGKQPAAVVPEDAGAFSDAELAAIRQQAARDQMLAALRDAHNIHADYNPERMTNAAASAAELGDAEAVREFTYAANARAELDYLRLDAREQIRSEELAASPRNHRMRETLGRIAMDELKITSRRALGRIGAVAAGVRRSIRPLTNRPQRRPSRHRYYGARHTVLT